MTLIAEGEKLYNNGKADEALEFYTKALKLNPKDKRGLVARSKCHLINGNVNAALKDAEASLAEDKSFFRGLYQKAEALYQKGDFEMSLVFYHRGHKIRPELTVFNLGIQKASEAIINSVGSPGTGLNQSQANNSGGRKSLTCSPIKNGSPQRDESRLASSDTRARRLSIRNLPADNKNKRRETIPCKKAQKNLLGELYVDKEYLESLEKDLDLMNAQIDPKDNLCVGDLVNSGIDFLNYKTDFWRQQKPLYARKISGKNIAPASDPVNDTLKIIVDMEEIERLAPQNFNKSVKLAESEICRIERCTEKQLQQAAIRAGSPLVSKAILIGELCLHIGSICMRRYQTSKDEKGFAKAESFFNRVYGMSQSKSKVGEASFQKQQDTSLDRLGRLYVMKNQLDKAIKTWEKREVLISGNKYELVVLYHDIGRAYLSLKQYKKANEYAHLSYTMVVDSVWKMNVMVLLAEIHLACLEINPAKRVLENCLAIAREEKDVGAEKAVTDLLDRLKSGFKVDAYEVDNSDLGRVQV